jgi:hypothetical protein
MSQFFFCGSYIPKPRTAEFSVKANGNAIQVTAKNLGNTGTTFKYMVQNIAKATSYCSAKQTVSLAVSDA